MKLRTILIAAAALLVAGCSSTQQMPVTPQSLLASVCMQQAAVVQNANTLVTPGQGATLLSILCGAQVPPGTTIPATPTAAATK